MRILMHTMACPERDVASALALASELGLDGIELIVQDNYACAISPAITMGDVRALAATAKATGCAIRALTPYTKGMNAKDLGAREQAVRELDHCLSMADAFGATAIRVFGGVDVPSDDHGPALSRMADALRKLGNRAQRLGVSLCIENHMDTMATSATATMDIVNAIDHPAFGVIYDQGNLDFMRAEAFPDALELQKGAVRHVHVKDFRWDPDGSRKATLLGDGIVPWPAIIATLKQINYDGHFTLEYERRWFPDQLPVAAFGCAKARDYLRSLP